MLTITTGKQDVPIRAIIYGCEGVGKSTLAAQIPGALLVDIEDGSHQIDCTRTRASDWRAI